MTFLDLSLGYLDYQWNGRNLPGFNKKKNLNLCFLKLFKIFWVWNNIRVSK